MACAALAPRQQLLAHPLSQLLVEAVAVQAPPTRERPARCLGDLREGLGGPDRMAAQPAGGTVAELAGELLVVIRDGRAPVQREVARGERMQRRPKARGQDQLAGVDRGGEALPRGRFGTRGERQQRRVALEVRRRAGGGLGKADAAAAVEAVAYETMGEDLLAGDDQVRGRAQRFCTSAAISAAAFFASSNSIDVFSS